nr:unnamed protein product [Digitaria exilis]
MEQTIASSFQSSLLLDARELVKLFSAMNAQVGLSQAMAAQPELSLSMASPVFLLSLAPQWLSLVLEPSAQLKPARSGCSTRLFSPALLAMLAGDISKPSFLMDAAIYSQTPNIRLYLVARGTDMMATPNAAPKIRCEIENVALNCGFFNGRWGDNGRFATGDDRGRLVCSGRLPGADTFGLGRRAATSEDV